MSSQTPLTKQERDWLSKLQEVLEEAPDSLKGKVSAYTIGDPCITIYDSGKVNEHLSGEISEDDVCKVVSAAKAEICSINFPFQIESTAG